RMETSSLQEEIITLQKPRSTASTWEIEKYSYKYIMDDLKSHHTPFTLHFDRFSPLHLDCKDFFLRALRLIFSPFKKS
ncbi:hypothetical protein SK128_026922, partial [Halocaridina rubra]